MPQRVKINLRPTVVLNPVGIPFHGTPSLWQDRNGYNMIVYHTQPGLTSAPPPAQKKNKAENTIHENKSKQEKMEENESKQRIN